MAGEDRDEAVRRITAPSPEIRRELVLADMTLAPVWSADLAFIQKEMGNPQTAAESEAKWMKLYWVMLGTTKEEPLVQDGEQAQRNFFAWADSLEARGYKLNIAGVKRMEMLAIVSSRCGGVRVTRQNLDVMFDKMVEQSAFPGIECSFDESRIPTQAPENTPTAADFESLNLGNAEDGRIGRRIAQDLFDLAARPVVMEWVSSLMSRFVYDITQDELYAVKNWMHKFNKPVTFEALEQCRKAFVYAGRFPESCLTHDDLRAACIEKINEHDAGYRDDMRIVIHGTLSSLKALMQRKNISAV